ncbi:zinc ribbon domain-containing protein [uncultured Halorubrum sp.]|mgnify:CR=1 FL=1|uniref:zinc ribbon domain-containing protein n=1 Tax=uncultured Halorubrum sp. TaxID=399555 RepID=UPI002606C983|nr:zinc ribbon domain-containing protein [uncultured Halorubrum sp.]
MTDHSRRRPWLAALLALVVSGLGHAYLRRWARAFGWYVAVTATVFVFVPESAITAAFAGTPPAVDEVAPAAAVVAASVIDAYVLARRNNRAYERDRDATPAAATSKSTGEAMTTGDAATTALEAPSAEPTDSDGTVRCPECGKETDPGFKFCQWCAKPLGANETT